MFNLDLTMADAKKQFALGIIKGYAIDRAMKQNVVRFSLQVDKQRSVGVLVDARTKQPRAFKTLDAAVSAIEQVGFSVGVLQGASW
jgi:hypothetical protein